MSKLYNIQGKVGTAAKLNWNVGLGVSGLGSEGVESDRTKILTPYSKAIDFNESDRQFALPTKLGEECAILATNATFDLLPRKTIQGGKSLNDSERQYIKNALQENGIQSEPNLTDSLQGDFDNDGEDEYLLAANTQKEEDGYPYISEYERSHPSGSYSMVILEETDGSFEPVYSEFNRYNNKSDEGYTWDVENCGSIDLLGAYDLDGNGSYEICLEYRGWEWGHVWAMAKAADGTYQTVMISYSGT